MYRERGMATRLHGTFAVAWIGLALSSCGGNEVALDASPDQSGLPAQMWERVYPVYGNNFECMRIALEQILENADYSLEMIEITDHLLIASPVTGVVRIRVRSEPNPYRLNGIRSPLSASKCVPKGGFDPQFG